MESNALPIDPAPANPVDWRALLDAAVSANPRGAAGVAVRLGFSRAYVARALATGKSASGFPQGVPARFINRVLLRLHVVECPARGYVSVPFSDCARAHGPCPTSNVSDVRLWRACQTCPHKPTETPS